MDCFRQLGLRWGDDERKIRRAYAVLIKQYRPDSHPAEFARIREAYEDALRFNRMRSESAAAQDELEQGDQWPDAPEQYDLQPEAQAREALSSQAPARELRNGQVEAELRDPNALVTEMIRDLDAQAAAGDEACSLQAFTRHWQALSAYPLDVQMEYVNALREWVIYSGRAPMQLILEAAERFGWHEQPREVERDYGRGGGHRLEMLLELADCYAEAHASRSPYLQIDGEYGRPPPIIASHYGADGAKQLAKQWSATCASAEMPELAGRLRYVLPRKLQVFWLDVFLALFVAVLTWLAVWPAPNWHGWAALVLISAAALFVPGLLRMAACKLGVDSPYRLGVILGRRYRERRARKLATDGENAVLTREVLFTVMIVGALIYGILDLTKGGDVMLWLGILVMSFMALISLSVLYNALGEMEASLTRDLHLLACLPQYFKARRAGRQHSSYQQPQGHQRRRRTGKSATKPATAGNSSWRQSWWILFVVLQVIRMLSGH